MPDLVLTPMETRVLQAMEAWYSRHDIDDQACTSGNIIVSGTDLFGVGWGGSEATGVYPVINRFLGRLASKGLVSRGDNEFIQEGFGDGFGVWGVWRLTSAGKNVLGIQEAVPDA